MTFPRSRWLVVGSLLGVILVLAIFSPRLTQPRALGGQPLSSPDFAQSLAPGDTLGQSFVARDSGLAGVELLITPDATAAAATLVAALYTDESKSTLLTTARLSLAGLPPTGVVRLPLAASFFSTDRRYYLELQGEDIAQPLVFHGAGPLSYVDGASYRNGIPQEAQLRFTPLYRPAGLLFDLVSLIGQSALYVAAYGVLFGLPGAALLALLAPMLLRDLRQGLLLAPVAGVALTPLLYLAGWLLHLPIQRLTIGLLLALSAFIVVRSWPRIRGTPDERPPIHTSDVVLLLVVVLIVVSRFAAARGLEGPAWGDAVQHAVISQRLTEANALFESWLPYAPYDTQTTHFGFSAATALAMELFGSDALHTTVMMGQWMNILAVLAIYPLAVAVGGRRWAGIGALVVAGLLMPIPAIYINWSRYAQLAGQVALPLAMLVLMRLTAPERREGRLSLLLGLLVAGIALLYYRMPIYLAWFGGAWALLYALPTWGRHWERWRLGLLHGAIAVVTASLVLLPWALRIRNSTLTHGAVAALAREPKAASIWADYQMWRDVGQFVPEPLLLLLVGVILVALFLRARWPIAVALWTLLLAGSQATQIFHFPLANYLQTFAILIMLYLPVGLLVGWLIGEMMTRLPSARARAALVALLLVAAGWGTMRISTIADASAGLLTRPDRLALEWVGQTLPPDALVLVNGFAIYGDTSFVGADGGWWLPLLAGRANTIPPQYAVLNEQPIESGYTKEMLDLILALRDQDLARADSLAPLCRAGVTHIYVGQRDGQAGIGVNQLLPSVELDGNPMLHLLHRVDRTRLYEVSADLCR